MTIGQRLKITREVLGLTQVDFARRAGIAASTYNQYETDVNVPALENANALCDAYAVTLDWIYRGDMAGLRFALADGIRTTLAAREVRG